MASSKRTRYAVVATVTMALAGLTACGSGDDENATGSAGVTFKGDPVTVITVAPVHTSTLNYPGIAPVAQGAVKAINAAGGLNGHEVKLISCNDQADPNKAADCARQAVKANAIAMVGGMNTGGDTMLPILAKAGIPWIGGYGLSAEELSSEYSFPLVQGAAGMAGLAYHVVKDDGCASVSFVLVEAATNQKAIDLVQTGVTKAGGGEINVVKVPGTTTDYSSVAKQVEDTDCTIIGMLSEPTAALVKAADTLGTKTQFYLVSGSLDGTVIKQAVSAIEGAKSMQPFKAASDPSWAEATEAVDDIDWEQPYYMNTWAAYEVLKNVASGLDDLTAQNLYAALQADTAETAGDTTAPIDFSKPFAVPGLERVLNHDALFVEAKDGKVAATGDFQDVIAPVFGG